MVPAATWKKPALATAADPSSMRGIDSVWVTAVEPAARPKRRLPEVRLSVENCGPEISRAVASDTASAFRVERIAVRSSPVEAEVILAVAVGTSTASASVPAAE